jgi:hypothetical protein
MIDVKKAMGTVGRLSVLKFFPADEIAKTEIVALVCRMAKTDEQIEWLVSRVQQLWNEWEGPRELRAVFCSKFTPADGIDAYSQLSRFADGIPGEKSGFPAIAAASTRRIAAGEVSEPVSAAQSLCATVGALAAAKNLNRQLKRKAAPVIPEIPPKRLKLEECITAEDMEKAAQEYRQAKAREEMAVDR